MDGAAAPLFEIGRRAQQVRRPPREIGRCACAVLRVCEHRRVQHGAGVRAHRVPVQRRPEAVETSRRGESDEFHQGAGLAVPVCTVSLHLLEPFRASRLQAVHLEQLRGVAEREADVGGGEARVKQRRASVKRLLRRRRLERLRSSSRFRLVRLVEGIRRRAREDAMIEDVLTPARHRRRFVDAREDRDSPLSTFRSTPRHRRQRLERFSFLVRRVRASVVAVAAGTRHDHREVHERARHLHAV